MKDPILTVDANNRRYTVHPMDLSPEALKMFWEKSRKYVTLFNEEINQDSAKFLDIFLDSYGSTIVPRGLFWQVEPDFMGVIYLTRIEPAHDALCHFAFFKGHFNTRAAILKNMAKYLMTKYQFHRLTAEVPTYVKKESPTVGKEIKSTFDLVESIGFKYEGRKRKAAEFDNKLFDVKIFGALHEDLFEDVDNTSSVKPELVTSNGS